MENRLGIEKYIGWIMIWLLMPFTLGAQTETAPKVLVVTSYNPDT